MSAAITLTSLDLGVEDKACSPPSTYCLLVSTDEGSRDHVLWKLSGRRAMHHRVRIFHADAICTKVRLRNVHNCIVGVTISPIALPLQHHRECCHWLGAGLYKTLGSDLWG